MTIPRSVAIPVLFAVGALVAALALFYRPPSSPPPPAPKPFTLAVRPFTGGDTAVVLANNTRTRLQARVNPNSTSVLSGTLQSTGDVLQLTCALTHPGEPVPFWSQRFERPSADVDALARDVAQAVQAALKLGPLKDHLVENRAAAESLAAHARSLWNPAHAFPHGAIIEEYRRALTLDPLLAEAHSELSWILLHVGPAQPAIAEARQAVDYDPENAEFRLRLALAYVYAARYQDAIDLFKTVPKTLRPLLWYSHAAWAHLELRQTTRANYYLEEYARLYGVDTDGLISSVNAMLQARYNNPHQASLAIAAALEDATDHGYFHHTSYFVGRAYALLGKQADARFWFQQSAKNGMPYQPAAGKTTSPTH